MRKHLTLPSAEIMRLAKAEGIRVTHSTIHNARSVERKKGKHLPRLTTNGSGKPAAKYGNGKAAAPAAAEPGSKQGARDAIAELEAQLARLALQIGYVRAHAIVEGMLDR